MIIVKTVFSMIVVSILLLAAQCQSSFNSPLPLPTPPSGTTIRIALLSPTTGELNTFGRLLRNGSIMAFDEWNERGGLLHHRIEWVIYDTRCQFDSARQTTEQVVADGFNLMIGPLCTESAIAAAIVAEQAGVLLISPTATHPLVTVDRQGHTRATVFRVAETWQDDKVTLADDSPQFQDWANRYKSRYAIEPDTLAMLGYDAAVILLTAIQQADTVAVTETVKALEQTTFNGVDKSITFDKQHNPKPLRKP